MRRTPVLRLDPVGQVEVPVWLKLECLQLTGSFKVRNAFAFLLGSPVPDAGVVAVSGGNFGLAMAYAARALGYPITVFVPELAPSVKVDGIRALGAEVVVVPGPVDRIFAASDERIARTGARFAHPYDQPAILAGAGTCGREFDEHCPGLDTVLVAVGGGGLIGGIAAWMGDRVRRRRHRATHPRSSPELWGSGRSASTSGLPRRRRTSRWWSAESLLTAQPRRVTCGT